MKLTNEQLLAYLKLPKIGRVKVMALGKFVCENKYNIENDLDMLNLLQYGISHNIVKGLKAKDYKQNQIQEALLEARRIIEKTEKLGISTISFFDKLYPDNLKTIIDEKGNNCSPLLLYTKGNNEHLKSKGIAIIGTREPTLAGIKASEYFATKFAEKGYNIISGLALGCDTLAHKGALKVKGITTAFVAQGLDKIIYPKENINLAEEILENNGLIVSEYPIGTSLFKSQLVERDRLQSGLADATLAIQTGIIGGTMHAVKATINNKKPLFMVKYKDKELLESKVMGNEKLIDENLAKPLTSSNISEAFRIIDDSKFLKQENNLEKNLFYESNYI